MNRKNIIGLTDFLKIYAPDFCWCSAYDLFIMTEQEPKFEDMTEDSFNSTLSNLKKQGFFITKKGTYRTINQSRGFIASLYLRVK